jgi:hypothetical protein
VLKDILLVACSIVIWSTTVTMLQFLGYSVALCGLVYYKLGGDAIKEHLGQVRKKSSEVPRLKVALVVAGFAGVGLFSWYAFFAAHEVTV